MTRIAALHILHKKNLIALTLDTFDAFMFLTENVDEFTPEWRVTAAVLRLVREVVSCEVCTSIHHEDGETFWTTYIQYARWHGGRGPTELAATDNTLIKLAAPYADFPKEG